MSIGYPPLSSPFKGKVTCPLMPEHPPATARHKRAGGRRGWGVFESFLLFN